MRAQRLEPDRIVLDAESACSCTSRYYARIEAFSSAESVSVASQNFLLFDEVGRPGSNP